MNQKRNVLIFILIAISSIHSSYGQDCEIFRINRLIAIGEVLNLPDTIIIFDNENEIDQNLDYSVMELIRKNRYRVWYWMKNNGGLVDPAICRDELIINQKRDYIELKFRRNRSKYICQETLVNEGRHEKKLIKISN